MHKCIVKLLCLLAWCVGGSCNGYEYTHKILPIKGYNRSEPVIVLLPETISQVSGIVYYPKDTSLFCLDDNIGVLYKYGLNTNALQYWPFSRKTDHEALAMHDTTFYAMKSNGDIEAVRFGSESKPVTEQFLSGTTIRQREFESMAYDSARKLLLLVCKDCEDDAPNKTSVWGVDFARKVMLPKPLFNIDHLEIEKKVGRFSKFKPSDMAIHPLTGDFYYVSAINDLLLVTDNNGRVKEAIALDHVLFKQPEGISFAPDGTLFITNEAADVGSATLLIYRYKPIKP